MSLLKAWKSVTSINGTAPPDSLHTLMPKRQACFLLRILLRKRPCCAVHDITRSMSNSLFWTLPNAKASAGGTGTRFELSRIGTRAALEWQDERDGRDVMLERSFMLSVLEGRRIAEVHRLPKGSTGTDDTNIGSTNREDTTALVSSGSPKALPPPPIPLRSRVRSASLGSAHSQSEDRQSRRVRPRPQMISLPELAEPRRVSDVSAELRWASKLLTYSATAYLTHAVAYRFMQMGTFKTTLEAELRTKEKGELSNGMWQYHIAAGVNVLTLRSWVTSVQRGSEDGLLVAEIE